MLGSAEPKLTAVLSIWLLLLLFFHQSPIDLVPGVRSLFTMWATPGSEDVRSEVTPLPPSDLPPLLPILWLVSPSLNINGFAINRLGQEDIFEVISQLPPPSSIWMALSCKKCCNQKLRESWAGARRRELGGRGEGAATKTGHRESPEHRRLIWHVKWFSKLKRSLKICWQSPH